MASKERFNGEITCPACGLTGAFASSEDDHPYMRDPGYTVDQLPDGMHVKVDNRWRDKTVIGCRCGTDFAPPM